MAGTTLTRLDLHDFTAFTDLSLDFSPGLNVLIGTNGTGKTHILKLLYAACDVSRSERSFADKLTRVFLPLGGIARLARRQPGPVTSSAKVHRDGASIAVAFDSPPQQDGGATSQDMSWRDPPIDCVYIPAKEILAHAPGFRSLYDTRAIAFDETYADLITRAYLPRLRGPLDEGRRQILEIIQQHMRGTVVLQGEDFFLESSAGSLEFSLVAEGLRKLALLWLLIQNGALPAGAALFWDEPEANLNPALMGAVAEILLGLRRLGVQIFVATHDYVLLKELSLRAAPTDPMAYHALFRGPAPESAVHAVTATALDDVHPNAIHETFLGLFDREAARDFAG